MVLRTLLGPLPQRILYVGIHRKGPLSQAVRGCVKCVDPEGNGGKLLHRLNIGVAESEGMQACEKLRCEVKVALQELLADGASAIMLNTIISCLGTPQ